MDQTIRPQTVHAQASPAEVRSAFQLKQMAVTFGMVAVTAILLSLVILFLNWSKGRKIVSIDQTITTKNQTIEATFGKIVKQQELIKKQIGIFKQTESEQVNYRQDLWEELGKRAVKQTRIVSLDLGGGKIMIEGEGETYSDIARQIISWKQSANFQNVKLESASADETGQKKFSASFNFKASANAQ